MRFLFEGVFIGGIATLGVDIWALLVKYGLKLPTADWALVGRWFGHMPKGVLVHRPIASAPPIPQERTIGWIGHYVIGAIYGLAYLFLVVAFLDGESSLISALGFGLATLLAPWLIMQPAMGAGVFASKTARPAVVRLVNLSMHAVFGVSLYLAGRLIL